MNVSANRDQKNPLSRTLVVFDDLNVLLPNDEIGDFFKRIPRSFLSFLFLSSSHRKSTIEYMTLYIQCQSMEQPRLRHKTGQTKDPAKIRWCKLRSKYLCHRKEKFSSNLGCLLNFSFR